MQYQLRSISEILLDQLAANLSGKKDTIKFISRKVALVLLATALTNMTDKKTKTLRKWIDSHTTLRKVALV